MNHHIFLVRAAEDASKQDDLIPYVANLLEDTVNRFDSENRKTLTAFTGLKSSFAPHILVGRLWKYCGASPCCFVCALIYLEKIKRVYPSIYVTSRSFVRLFVTSTMIAAKFYDDSHQSNKVWAELGGLSAEEMKRLELEFLFLLNFRTYISRQEYDWYSSELRAHQRTVNLPKDDSAFSIDSLCSLFSMDSLLSVIRFKSTTSSSTIASDDSNSSSEAERSKIACKEKCSESSTFVIYHIPPAETAQLDMVSLQRYVELYIA